MKNRMKTLSIQMFHKLRKLGMIYKIKLVKSLVVFFNLTAMKKITSLVFLFLISANLFAQNPRIAELDSLILLGFRSLWIEEQRQYLLFDYSSDTLVKFSKAELNFFYKKVIFLFFPLIIKIYSSLFKMILIVVPTPISDRFTNNFPL